MYLSKSVVVGTLLAITMFVSPLFAETLKLNRYHTDGMVVQRDAEHVVRGFAKPGSTIELGFAGQTHTTTAADDGTWAVTLKPTGASAKGQTLTVRSSIDGGGQDTVKIHNVLVGDVYLYARQTTVDVAAGDDAAIGKGAAAPLRVVTIPTQAQRKPQADLGKDATSGWSKLTKDRAAAMSVAGVGIATGLAASSDVPVGVIELNMAGYFPIAWLSSDEVEKTAEVYGNNRAVGQMKRMYELADLRAAGEPLPGKSSVRSDPLRHPLMATGGYNAVLHPMRGVGLKAVVLQLGGNYPYMLYAELEDEGTHLDRGELNRAYVETYEIRKTGFRLDPITQPRVPFVLREVFNDADLPIGMVVTPGSQLATLAARHRENRELQRQIARDQAGVDLILPPLENVALSAQVKDEALLAKRAVQWAKGQADESQQPAVGPTFDRIKTYLNTATVHFRPGSAQGLKAIGDPLTGFEVSGVEGEFFPALATVEGTTVKLTSSDVNRVSRVRYNWQDYPGEQLLNAAGLPAEPFLSYENAYAWFQRHSEDDLPIEYSTPANTWQGGAVTLINGQTKTFGYDNFAGWLGPVGVRVGPFGPNMSVRDVLVGSPAEGKLFIGDVIYSANGQMLGEQSERVMSHAITQSETKAMGGVLTLGVRRSGENIDVPIQLEVMGTYSPTAPYDCPKTDKIVKQLEDWLVERGGVGDNFLSTDVLFLLGSDNPEHQGLVRRYIYQQLPNIHNNGVNWYLGYDAMLLGEYYLATGDRNVLPAMEKIAKSIADVQIDAEAAGPSTGRLGGWYGKNKQYRAYPAMPPAGAACMIGLHLAREAGVNIDESAYQRGLEYFQRKGAHVGFVIYGDAYRDEPAAIDPNQMLAGKLSSDNGKISIAGVLFDLAGDEKTAYVCSLLSTHAYNNTFPGHGGNFWNNFWTPLGANVHGKEAFLYFMDGHRWYRELNRFYDGSLQLDEGKRVGTGHGLALVVPKQRLRILGAPKSPFAADAPESLAPAVAAYHAGDYETCESLVDELIAGGSVPKADRPTVEKLAHEARQKRLSIEHDVQHINTLSKAGRIAEAKSYASQLQTLLPDDDPRQASIASALKAEARPNDAKLYNEQRQNPPMVTERRVPNATLQNVAWSSLVSEITASDNPRQSDALGKVPADEADQANQWRRMVVEHMDQAPTGWMEPSFDDSQWDQTTLPISWRLNHTALLRTTFHVEDKTQIDKLRFRAWLFRQQSIEIYLNGELIGKVNNLLKKTGNVDATFEDGALAALRDGENTLAISTRQNWRWGMLFMRVYNDGFGFMLDAGKKQEPEPDAAE